MNGYAESRFEVNNVSEHDLGWGKSRIRFHPVQGLLLAKQVIEVLLLPQSVTRLDQHEPELRRWQTGD